MINLIEGAGIFIWPLGLFSVVAVFIIVERLIALRPSRIMPPELENSLLKGEIKPFDGKSVGGRIVQFHMRHGSDPDGIRAFAQLEITRLERGFFLLDVVVSGAPMIGLLGTVWGLVQVFSHVSLDTGIPEASSFVQGIALALTTTMLGLIIAITGLIGNSYLNRRVDYVSACIHVSVQRIIDLAGNQPEAPTKEP